MEYSIAQRTGIGPSRLNSRQEGRQSRQPGTVSLTALTAEIDRSAPVCREYRYLLLPAAACTCGTCTSRYP